MKRTQPSARPDSGITPPPAFIDSLREFLAPEEIPPFLEALEGEASCSVRANPCKGWCPPHGAVPVAWCDEGFSLPERPLFTLDPAFHGGAYYVQEAGSMFVGYLARHALDMSGSEHPCVLDLCAAPGGKSTHLSSLLGERGTLVANEVIRGRVSILADNIRKWGLANTIVTGSDPAAFGAMGGLFDIMVIDAPCSGEGMFRKEPEALAQWSPDNVRMCVERGRRIIADAWDALAEGGILIYSTCTYNRHENEETVEWIADSFDTEAVDIPLPENSGITVTEASGGGVVHRCYRFMPHRT
ncbi:MAG: RsmB/NOP family class I SAM-dependent RNA methyltransferase, partial [Rikenellaceae bacterium]|nr:RsmB/NOP family class I SAM-dependent RNA methyltransferase [Rikenellaceae bacterium]